MKYFANFKANNGTHYQNPIEDTNKARIIKDIRDIAEGNRFENSECSWLVWDETGTEVARGGCRSDGKRYRAI